MFGVLAFAAVAAFGPTDPATIWNREELYKVPKTWDNQGTFKGEVTPMGKMKVPDTIGWAKVVWLARMGVARGCD